MRLHEIAETSADLTRTRSRKAKVERLVRCLRALAPDEARAGASWLAGLLTQGRIGVGPAGVREAASAPRSGGAPLELREVERALDEIASASGAGAGRERGRRLAALFESADPTERDFLARLLLGELRQGASQGLLVEALAAATQRPLVEVRRAQMGEGSLGELATALLGGEDLARFAPSLFRPVLPMLAQPAEDLDDALARLGEAAFEYKLDGARIQLHKAGHDVRIFSRGQRDVGDAVPEIADAARALPVHEIVLDGEVLAFQGDGRPAPFQVTCAASGDAWTWHACARSCRSPPSSSTAWSATGAGSSIAPPPNAR
jgi:DNA ligase-1